MGSFNFQPIIGCGDGSFFSAPNPQRRPTIVRGEKEQPFQVIGK